MRAFATSLVLASVAVLSLSGGAVAGRKSTLAPGASSSDADAAGEMRLIRRGRRAAALQVRLRNLDPNSLYGVRATQGGGKIGDVPTDRRGRGRVRFGSRELPGGAASMVSGMALEVFHEESGEVVLTGDVPHEGHDGADGAGGGDATPVREAAAVFEADGGIRAVMSLRSDPDHGSERMALRASGMGPDGTYDVFLSRGGDSVEKVGSLEANEGEKHCERHVEGEHVVEICTWTENWQWMVDTADGDGLPFDEAGLDALVGRRFEIRDREGHVLLRGEVPHFHEEETPPPDGGGDTPPAVHEASADFSGDGDVRANVFIRSDPAHSSERLAVKVSGLGLDGHFVLFVANADGGMDDIAVLTVDGGFLWYWQDTIHDGQYLPFHVERVSALSGRRFEVRDGDGRVRVHGEIPHFAD